MWTLSHRPAMHGHTLNCIFVIMSLCAVFETAQYIHWQATEWNQLWPHLHCRAASFNIIAVRSLRHMGGLNTTTQHKLRDPQVTCIPLWGGGELQDSMCMSLNVCSINCTHISWVPQFSQVRFYEVFFFNVQNTFISKKTKDVLHQLISICNTWAGKGNNKLQSKT